MVVYTPSNNEEGYLSGQLLIATPSLSDGCFDRSVIYLCEHNAEGAMGVIINHPVANIRMGEILKALSLQTGGDISNLPVYFGGPVDAHRGFVLHTADQVLEDSVVGSDGITLTANVGMLKGIAEGQGPRQGFLVLGYAGWGAGQLESEIESGSWITAPATRKLVFEADNDLKWSLAAASLGVDIGRFANVVGHA
jgi:putative transcriptional regulator